MRQTFWAEGRKWVMGRVRAAAVGRFISRNCPTSNSTSFLRTHLSNFRKLWT